MVWFIRENDLMKFINSPAFKEMEQGIEEMGKLFESASEDVRTECQQALEKLLKVDAVRETALEQGLLEEEDFQEQERRESLELARSVSSWFPSLAYLDQEELIDHAHMLMSYYLRKKEIN